MQWLLMMPATSRQDDGARNSLQSPHLWLSREESLKSTQACETFGGAAWLVAANVPPAPNAMPLISRVRRESRASAPSTDAPWRRRCVRASLY
jgi:hypothetical protein